MNTLKSFALSPECSWKYVVLAAIVFVIMFILLDVYVFFSFARTLDTPPPTPHITIEHLDRNTFENALRNIRTREEKYKSIQESTVLIPNIFDEDR